ncbi:MmgE/PrpD family protein [Microvirga tunisiensis]|uniref:MmgE/PrpD family protein n=1 Tax=Microvirga tunisiensis TaxID=2108360 RepID=A0A5N7MAB7_9HYPH|nr:MmgE/PrpD family protein [Microvirga tunisiensis]MPR05486.1 MmgE/PrpD family protein [Microvirga tunisiensis]MPR23687.1 MmgE/PrpD family protein [Microvirga tunisiensis]
MPADQDLCYVFADFAANASYKKLPEDAIEGAKRSILDTLGVILAASGMEPASRVAVDLARESGGRPESTILAFGGKVPAVMAAFANGAMAHSLDYDDQTPWGQHASSTLIPAVFAVSERKGQVSGKEMITAVAIGQDLFNRLRRHIDWKKDWFFTTVMGVFSATAAAGRVLNLPANQIANALGIASLQSSGTTEMINATGSDLRAIYAGFPAKGAVLATLLAERGLSGIPTLFEGRYGILSLYFGGRYDRERIISGLGEEFTGGLTLYKRWPAVGTAHSHIHATMALVKENNLSPDDIDEIRVFVGDYHQLMSEPLEVRRAPKTLVDAKFSLPFLVAVAAVRGDMRLADFTDEALGSPEVLAAAQKVVPIEDRSLDWKLELPPGRVEIVMRDGRRFERVGTGIPGSVEAPMSWQDIVDKFDDCVATAATPFPAAKVRRIRQLVQSLEEAEDATELLRLAAGG